MRWESFGEMSRFSTGIRVSLGLPLEAPSGCAQRRRPWTSCEGGLPNYEDLVSRQGRELVTRSVRAESVQPQGTGLGASRQPY